MEHSPGRVLVVALTDAKADLLSRMLSAKGIEARRCAAERLPAMLEDAQSAAVLIEEEALVPTVIRKLAAVMSRDAFPLIVLTGQGPETALSRRLEEERRPLSHVITLPWPTRACTLVSSVEAALSMRSMQVTLRNHVTALDAAQRANQAAEQRHASLLRTTRDCIKLLDLDGRILSIDADSRKHFGIVDFEAVRSHAWSSLWLPEHRPAAQEMIRRAVAGEQGQFGTEFVRSDGAWWDVAVTPLREQSGNTTHLLAIAREVTRRKQVEKALIESEKLAALGRMSASIAHEIINPLEAVTNLLYLVGHDEELTPATRAYLSLADQELARVSQIAWQTLRFHRTAPRARSVTPGELLEPVLVLYQKRLQRSQISTEVDADDQGQITCYEGDIRQVLNNLVSNAIDAMSSGGRLRVRARRGRDWQRAISGTWITIADTGEGMSAEVAGHIFNAFFTTKGLKGSGLGLWISHGIVEKHGGRLRVRSRMGVGSGTVFRLFLPADAAEPGEPQ